MCNWDFDAGPHVSKSRLILSDNSRMEFTPSYGSSNRFANNLRISTWKCHFNWPRTFAPTNQTIIYSRNLSCLSRQPTTFTTAHSNKTQWKYLLRKCFCSWIEPLPSTFFGFEFSLDQEKSRMQKLTFLKINLNIFMEIVSKFVLTVQKVSIPFRK